jgi:hypothetical protein
MNDHFEYYKAIVGKDNYKLISYHMTKYGARLITACPNNHHYEATINNWNAGHRCKQCKVKVYTIEDVKQSFENNNYRLLTTTYTTGNDYYQFICPNNHTHQITFFSWLKGNRCGLCKAKQIDINQLAEHVAEYNLTLLNKVTTHTEKMKLKCNGCDYLWTVSFYRWRNYKSKGCVRCRKQTKYTEEQVKQILNKEGYNLTSQYENVQSTITAICPNDHEYSFTFTNFLQGYRCGKCSNKNSKPEFEIIDELNKLNIQSIHGDRKLIKPKELDIYIPSHKLAIEYCGLYWHREQSCPPQYHYDKMKLCNDKQVRLITIFEDEWINNKQICLSRIKNALNISNKTIYTRDCQTKQIDLNTAYLFLNSNDLQKDQKGTVAFGLYYQGQLIQVIVGEDFDNEVLLINSIVSKIDTVIIEGDSKLFESLKQYAIDNRYKQIRVRCDIRWETGAMYQQLGFMLVDQTRYSPHYFKQLTRVSDVHNLTTEILDDWLTIYDCGHQIWAYDL